MDQRNNTHDRAASGVVMADIWTQPIDPPVGAAVVVGFAVESKDAAIGKVDEATETGGIGRLIVDCGASIAGKKLLLPFGIIEHIDLDTETVFLDRTTEEIESAPEFDPATHGNDARYYALIGEHYAV